MPERIDSYKFVDFVTRKIIRAWIQRERVASIPWTPLPRPLEECTVSLLSTAGIALKDDRPFDQEGERANPWWGDPSFRRLPRETTAADVRFYHLHTATGPGESDLDCVLPLRRLRELEAAGEVGRTAPTHYSIMGYLLRPEAMLEQSAPAIAAGMRAEAVDIALLVPF